MVSERRQRGVSRFLFRRPTGSLPDAKENYKVTGLDGVELGNAPVVRLEDSAEDLEILLNLLYEPL